IGSTIFKLPIGTERIVFFCAAAGPLIAIAAQAAAASNPRPARVYFRFMALARMASSDLNPDWRPRERLANNNAWGQYLRKCARKTRAMSKRRCAAREMRKSCIETVREREHCQQGANPAG